MKPSTWFTLFGTALILSGCGPAALPDATTRPVTDSDVVGRWRYLGDYKATTIEIEFTPDHEFVQTVTGAGGATKTQHGTWVLDHAYLQLHDVLLNDSVSGFSLSAWNPKDSSWWFTDESGHLELYGGEASFDPDQCNPLEKLGPPKTPSTSAGTNRNSSYGANNSLEPTPIAPFGPPSRLTVLAAWLSFCR